MHGLILFSVHSFFLETEFQATKTKKNEQSFPLKRTVKIKLQLVNLFFPLIPEQATVNLIQPVNFYAEIFSV